MIFVTFINSSFEFKFKSSASDSLLYGRKSVENLSFGGIVFKVFLLLFETWTNVLKRMLKLGKTVKN